MEPSIINPPCAVVHFQTLLSRELESNLDAIRSVQEPERKCPYCKHMVETETFLEHKMGCKEGLIKFPKPKKSQFQWKQKHEEFQHEFKKAQSERSNWRKTHEEFQILCKQGRGVLPPPEYTGPRKEKHPSSITLQSIKIEENCPKCNRKITSQAFAFHVKRCCPPKQATVHQVVKKQESDVPKLSLKEMMDLDKKKFKNDGKSAISSSSIWVTNCEKAEQV